MANRVRVTLSVPPAELELWRAEAARRNRSLSMWVRESCEGKLEAARKYLSMQVTRQKRVAEGEPWPSGWPRELPCGLCKRKHDPKEHNISDEYLQTELKLAQGEL